MSAIQWAGGRRAVRGWWVALAAVVVVTMLGFGGFQLWRVNRVAQAEAATQAPPQIGVNAITMRDFEFGATHIQVRKGETVTWTNADSEEHNVVFDSGNATSSPLLAQGQIFQATFHTPGEYRYVCTLHASMIAKVTVTP